MRRLLLALALLFLAAPATAAWNEARTRHFIIYSQQKPEELRRYAERLERFDAAVRAVRQMADPPLTDGGKLTIYVLPTASAVGALLGDENVGGFYIGRAGGSIAVVGRERIQTGIRRIDPEQIFFHEYMHHLMLGDLRAPLPSWMIEGYAEFFSTARIEEDGSVLFGAPPIEHATVLLQDLGFSARDLLAGRAALDGLDTMSVYAKGWLLTHYLTFEPSRAGQLQAYVAGMIAGKSAERSAVEAFGDLNKLDKELDRYAGGRSFRALRSPPIPSPQITVRPLSPGASAIMAVRIRSDRGASGKRSQNILEDARRIAASHPNDPFVMGVLAEAEYDVRNYREAISAADRALAVDPRQVQALTYKGSALMELGRAEPAKADWATIRRLFIQANRLDTENAEPLWLYHQSFIAAGQQPPADAVKGLLYAHTLAPQDRGLRYAAVRQMLKDGDHDRARLAFAPIVFDPHLDKKWRPRLQAVLERIEAKDSAGALAKLDEDHRPGQSRS